MQTILNDVRYSVRRLLTAGKFTLAITLILALGIGANSALFTAIDRVVVRPLPYREAGRLTMLWEDFTAFGVSKNRVSPATYLDWRKRTRTFEDLAAHAGPMHLNILDGGTPEEVLGQSVSASLLPLLGVQPLLGRTFNVSEEAPGSKVIMLSYGLWQRRFLGDPNIIGKAIQLSGEKYDVVGVMPDGFQYPDRQSEFWLPLGLSPQLLARRNSHFLYVIGKLKPGIVIQESQTDMSRVGEELAQEFPATNARIGIRVVDLKDEFLEDSRNTFIILLSAAACVLLIACANVANLLLARSAARQQEVAVRTALGASPGRLLRQILTENLILSLCGGALGLVLANWMIAGLQNIVAANMRGIADLELDFRTLVFAGAISLVTGLLFGVVPAVRLARARVFTALRGGRTDVADSGNRLRNILVVAEVALAVVLAIGAVLLIQTLTRLRSFDAGFKSAGILTATVNAPSPRYRDATVRQRFYDEIIRNTAAIPGVKSVGLASDLPYTSRGNTMSIRIENYPVQGSGLGRDVLFRLVSAGYLETIGAKLIEGRLLETRDRNDTESVVVVNEALARQYWPGESPIGRRIDTGTGDGNPKWMAIVGVVRDIRERGLDLDSKAAVYVPFTQTTIGFFIPSQIAVLTSRPPLEISKELQQAVWAVDPEQPVVGIATMDSIVDTEFSGRSQVLRLLGAFAALAVLLAAFGTYSVISYIVSLRTREIGLRIAIGANRRDIVTSMVWYSARLTAAGIVMGLLCSVVATQLLSSLLFGISRLDPMTFAAVSVGLAVVALIASALPVLRASRIDPMIALRSD